MLNTVFSQNIDSLIKVLPSLKNDTIKLEALRILSENLPEGVWQPYNLQMGVLSEQILSSGETSLSKRAKYYYAAYLGNAGYDKENQGQSDSALVYYYKSLALRKEIEDKVGISNSYNNIGLAMHHKGDLKNALEYYYKALKVQEEINDKLGMGYSLSNIGYLLYNQGEPDKAIEYFKKSLVIRKEINDLGGLAFSLLNLGHTFKQKGQIDSALTYFEQSLAIREKIGDQIGVGYSLANIASIFQLKGNYEMALTYYFKGLKIQEEVNDPAGIAATLNSIGQLYFYMKQYRQAIEYGQRTLAIGKRLGYPSDIYNGARLLYRAYKESGNAKEALAMFDLSIQMRDSLASEDARKANLKKQMEYEFGKKEAEVTARSEAEKERIQIIAAEEKRKQNTIIAGVSIVLVLVLFLAAFIYRSLRENKRKNRIISEQKAIVEHKQKEILDSIYYARRIQRSLLPHEKYIERILQKTSKQ